MYFNIANKHMGVSLKNYSLTGGYETHREYIVRRILIGAEATLDQLQIN
jgi:hypothetical protein